MTTDRDQKSQHLVSTTAERDRLARELDVVVAARLLLETECRRLGSRNEQLAKDVARIRNSGLVRRLGQWISTSFTSGRPHRSGQAVAAAQQDDTGSRTAA